ncbi:MAG: transketolase [Actinomycetota bacterium]|nr:transketolase [Actinomycetota bacterium]
MGDETRHEQLGINVIRGLALDAPQRAGSGHCGPAMALAPLAHVLWTRVMRHDPSEPSWPDRDRFVVSAGHASILLYSMLYLTGYELSLDDLRAFRQGGGKTPGHPDAYHAEGVEVTTGPLGEGFANAVGMGLAERWLRATFGPEVCDHHTFVVCSDGDLQEGISHEAASLAGHLGLGRLVYVYDASHVTVGSPTELSFSEDVVKRFEAYGWQVDPIGDVANDTAALEDSLRRAMAVEDRPSLIVLRSHLGWPSPIDTEQAHGHPLGEEEVRATKEALGLPADETFWVPDEVLELYRACVPRGQAWRREWAQRLEGWDGDRPQLEACLSGRGLDGWHAKLPTYQAGDHHATRAASNDCINAVADVVPGLVAGGADLTGNTGTKLADHGVQSAADPRGRLVCFGAREHGMGSVLNGAALHGGIVPVGGTSFICSDSMRASVRSAAVTQAKVVYSWTHDSEGPGEDGPTHQPVEQLAAARAMPGLRVIRPADANEVVHAWRVALDSNGPTALVLSGQKVPVLEGTADRTADLARGAYVLGPADDPEIVLVGTGSEVHVCVGAAERLAAENVRARVVSMPSWELFEDQGDEYQEAVLPSDKPTLAVEAAASFGWDRWADDSVSIDGFGASAAGATVSEKLGFTPDHVAERAKALLAELAEGW